MVQGGGEGVLVGPCISLITQLVTSLIDTWPIMWTFAWTQGPIDHSPSGRHPGNRTTRESGPREGCEGQGEREKGHGPGTGCRPRYHRDWVDKNNNHNFIGQNRKLSI